MDVESINIRINDLKEHINQRFDAQNKLISANINCHNCKNKDKIKHQWWHIVAIWSAIGSFVITFFRNKL